VTPHHENDPESALPKQSTQRSQVTKMKCQNMPVHCQRMLRVDVPVVNRFKGTSLSKKVTQGHEIVLAKGQFFLALRLSPRGTSGAHMLMPCFDSLIQDRKFHLTPT
jgi:hypothetical protein